MKQHKLKISGVTEDLPSRNLIKKSPFRTTGGVFIEGLTPYPAQWESYLERYAIPAFSMCHDIKEIRSQPFTEIYKDLGGIEREYTPDFLLKTLCEKEIIVEIKSLRFLFEEPTLNLYIAIAKHFQSQSKKIVFLIDTQIEEQPRFDSVKLLFRYRSNSLPRNLVSKVCSFIGNQEIVIKDLMNLANVGLGEIYTLIAHKELCIDWTKPINKNSKVSLINKPYKGIEIDDLLSSGIHCHLLAELGMGIRPTNKRLLAIAKIGRRLYRSSGAFSVISGFHRTTPIRDLEPDERPTRSAWDRADQAPGRSSSKKIFN